MRQWDFWRLLHAVQWLICFIAKRKSLLLEVLASMFLRHSRRLIYVKVAHALKGKKVHPQAPLMIFYCCLFQPGLKKLVAVTETLRQREQQFLQENCSLTNRTEKLV